MPSNEATLSTLIPLSDLSIEQRAAVRRNVEDILVRAAVKVAIRQDPADLIIRDTLPNTDLGLAAQEDWLIAGAGVVATELQYFSQALANDRCVAFYGVGIESAPGSVARLRLTLGAASAQIRGVFQLEQLLSRLEPAGYFSEPVLFTRNETCRVMVMPRLAFAANSERLHLFARTVEPIGAVVSAPSV